MNWLKGFISIANAYRSLVLSPLRYDGTRAGFEYADRFRSAAVQQRRDLRVRVDRHEAAAELIALPDVDEPSVILGADMAERQQLFEHDRDLHAVRRAERIELQRVG